MFKVNVLLVKNHQILMEIFQAAGIELYIPADSIYEP